MCEATDSTLWPSALIAPKVKQLIKRFFSLVDDQDDNAGSRLASEVFTEDGKFFASSGSFEGAGGKGRNTSCLIETPFRRLSSDPFSNQTEIARSRKGVWDSVASRQHRVDKVYVNDVEGLDLLVVGTVAVQPRGGEPKSHQFLARILLRKAERTDVSRMEHYEVLMSGKDSILGTASRK